MPPKKSVTSPPADLSLEDKINHIFSMVNKIDATLAEQQAKVIKMESDIFLLNKEVSSLKNIVNSHEQSSRSHIIRISGFPLSEAEKSARDSAALKSALYERIISPVLTAAVNKNLIDSLPSINNSILSCYRVGAKAASANSAPPPPLVVKLSNPQLRVAILKAKREAKFGPTEEEKALGFRGFYISEDLTQPAFKKLKELQNREECSKAWSIDGRIFFMLTGSDTIHRVQSVFETIETSLGKSKP